jgi:purine-nucleoside phosphorylase
MPTPHNDAQPGDIAKVVLMPGDPLRAKHIAETFLQDAKLFSGVRNMLGYTGTYEGVPVSVMGSGMGIPSICIYAYELYNFYNVDTIIRIGSAGGLAPGVELRDVILAQAACTNSHVVEQFGVRGSIAPICDFGLLQRAAEVAQSRGVRYHVGNVLSTDIFYGSRVGLQEWANMGVLAVEMEAAGLYLTAAQARKKALGIMTVSDLPLSDESLPALERQNTFDDMVHIALAVALKEA